MFYFNYCTYFEVSKTYRVFFKVWLEDWNWIKSVLHPHLKMRFGSTSSESWEKTSPSWHVITYSFWRGEMSHYEEMENTLRENQFLFLIENSPCTVMGLWQRWTFEKVCTAVSAQFDLYMNGFLYPVMAFSELLQTLKWEIKMEFWEDRTCHNQWHCSLLCRHKHRGGTGWQHLWSPLRDKNHLEAEDKVVV